VLLLGDDDSDPLFLQIKEAQPSVYEALLGASQYANAGQRVVEGQRLMQATSDIFLGWLKDDQGHDFYMRQLRDMKVSIKLDALSPVGLTEYAAHCAWALARAHARTGDPAEIAGYLGRSDRFDRALVRFARSYADQVEADYASFVKR